MRADDPKLKRLEPPKLTLAERFFLPQIAAGLGVTARHIGRRGRSASKAITVQYPEEQHVPSPNYRGVHRLNKDEQGRVKCVACMLCATACPAHCIDIVGATAPDDLARPREVPRELRHRRAALHLLRHVRGGLPGRGDRADRPLRLDRPVARGDDLRQDQAALGLRRDQGRRADAVRPRPPSRPGDQDASSPLD